MPSSFSATEIVDIAKQIESAGEAFYAEALKHLKDPQIVKIFAFLRDEERRHGAAFEALLANLQKAGDWRQDEQYLGYLRVLADDRVFPDPARARSVVAMLEDDEAAIRYALGFEKDSILFLYEMKTMMREEDQPMVERLIAEEKSHVLRLHALLAERGATQPTDKGRG